MSDVTEELLTVTPEDLRYKQGYIQATVDISQVDWEDM
jgi:uncharacterized protein (DUF2141 family)